MVNEPFYGKPVEEELQEDGKKYGQMDYLRSGQFNCEPFDFTRDIAYSISIPLNTVAEVN